MTDVFGLLDELGAERCTLFSDRASGLRAVLVLDDLTLGPAAGGVRTAPYASVDDAIRDAFLLAQAMTIKCALADLGAGGGKIVVLEHPEMDRERAFEALGTQVEHLKGLFRTSGDFGTTRTDLRAMARRTRYVNADEEGLARAVARGVLRSIEALQDFRGAAPAVSGLRVAVQGCGVIGEHVARLLSERGAEVVVADLVRSRAENVAAQTGADILPVDELPEVEADVFAPCAHGNWLDVEAAGRIGAKAICGAASNVLTDLEAARRLRARGIVHVPGAISSAGAVIEGIGRTVMGLPDRTPLIDHLGRTALAVLKAAQEAETTPYEAAERLARARIEEARARSRDSTHPPDRRLR